MTKQSQSEFIRRGREAIARTVTAGDGVPADAVIAKLDAKLAAANTGNDSEADAAGEERRSIMKSRECGARIGIKPNINKGRE